jgi:hypothetical protein
MKTGKELIEYIKQAEPLQRAEILINEIDPYLHKGMSIMDGPILTREEAMSIYISRAVELFECPEAEIEKGFNEYGYFFPFEIFNKYYYDHERHHFIIEVSRVICEKNAKSLFTDLVKKEVDSKIEEYERTKLPISEAVTKIKEKYEFWSKIPKPYQDMTTYYCWTDFIEPYLQNFLIPHSIKMQKLRLPAAFCVCMDYIEGKFDISGMTKATLKKYVRDKFQEGLSDQKIVNTLLGYLPDKKNEKAFFSYKGKSWQFRQDNFDYMKVQFAEEYRQAENMQSKLK